MNPKEPKVHEIARILADSMQMPDVKDAGIGLYTGKFGILLFLAHYAERFPNESNRRLLDRYLEECCNDLCNNVAYLYTFCSGLAGAMSSVRLMSELSLIDLDISDIETQYKPVMLRQMEMFLNHNPGNYDFMHGALGIALHYRTDPDFIGKIVSWLNEHANREFPGTRLENWLRVRSDIYFLRNGIGRFTDAASLLNRRRMGAKPTKAVWGDVMATWE